MVPGGTKGAAVVAGGREAPGADGVGAAAPGLQGRAASGLCLLLRNLMLSSTHTSKKSSETLVQVIKLPAMHVVIIGHRQYTSLN